MSNNLEPIELELIVTNEDLKQKFIESIQQAKNADESISKSGKNISETFAKTADASAKQSSAIAETAKQTNILSEETERAKQRFSQFVADMEASNAALDCRAKLTDSATKALERHHTIIEGLKGQVSESLDPLSIAQYQYQIEQANEAMQKIIEVANKKIELLDPAEIELANEKIREATTLLDKISDGTISPHFSPDELDVLSNQINKTDDAFEQLGAVIDFVQAKMHTMDLPEEEFAQLQKDISSANELLGRTPQLYDTTGNSINQLTDAMKVFQDQLSSEKEPENIKILNKNIEACENRINQLKNSGKQGFDELGNKIKEGTAKVTSTQTEIRNLVNEMAKLRAENKSNTKEYEQLKNKAFELRNALQYVNAEVNQEIKGTTKFDALLKAASGITAGYTLAVGAMGAFNVSNEEAQKTIQKVTSAMAILQALQQITIQLKTADATVTNKQTAVQAIYSTVVGTSTGALKLFRIALASTGIGLIIILLASLIANWDKVTASIKNTFPALKDFRKTIDEIKSYVMGFLRSYLSLYETVFKTIVKLINLDLKGALEEVKNTGKNAVESFKKGKEDSLQKSEQARRDEQLKKMIEQREREIEVIEARTGKKQYGERVKLEQARQRLVKKGSEEEIEAKLKVNMLLAEKDKERNDAAKKAADKADKEAEKRRKKLLAEEQKLADARKQILEKIASAEENLQNKEEDGGEIAIIKKKYAALRREAQKLDLGRSDMMRIDIAENREVEMKTYDIETKNLMQNLDDQKKLFAAYEVFKTKVSKEEAEARYGMLLKSHQDFGEILDEEIKKLEEIKKPNHQEQERLKGLKDEKKNYDENKNQENIQKFTDAYNEYLDYNERLKKIDQKYQDDKLQIAQVGDENLRAAKMKELDRRKNLEKAAVFSEYHEREKAEEVLAVNLIGITTRVLKNRIATLQEFMKQDVNLTEEQRKKLEDELEKAQNALKTPEISRDEDLLLQRKKQIMIEINALKEKGNNLDDNGNRLIAEYLSELENVNHAISQQQVEKFQKAAEWGAQIANAFGELADAVDEGNSGLVQMIKTVSELASDVGNVLSAFSKGLIDGIVSLVATAIKWVGKLFTMGKRSRESARQAAEEMKKYNDSVFQSMLDYNSMLRQRMVDETKLNDLYKSRVDNIKEEMAARSKAMSQNLREQQALFNKILNMSTTVGQYTEKYGGFLGMGKKTRVVDLQQSISSLLGLSNGQSAFTNFWDKMFNNPFFQRLKAGNSPFKNLIPPDTVIITDEMFEKLEKINAEHPLTGDAKTAYEQLKKLRDEYGSFEEANRQLEIQLKNAITGTTAQSLADSIREGLKSGKKSFADFANDIEGFLREAILAGISAKMIEPKIQELQDALADMMGDGILSAEEREQFQQMYMAIVSQSQEYMDIVNQAGIGIGGPNSVNSLSGAFKAMSQESADIMGGQLGGMRMAQLETNQILRAGGAQQLEKMSEMIVIQMNIERNTRTTARNTEKLYDVDDNIVKVAEGQDKYYKALQAAGIIK